MAARRRDNTRDTSRSVETASSIAEAEELDPNEIISADDALHRQEELDKQFAAMAAETEERDPNEIISADDALKRAEAMDALAKEAEDPMAALLAADEAETAAPPVPDDAASALAELMASSDDEPASSDDDDDYDPFAALDDFGDQKEA